VDLVSQYPREERRLDELGEGAATLLIGAQGGDERVLIEGGYYGRVPTQHPTGFEDIAVTRDIHDGRGRHVEEVSLDARLSQRFGKEREAAHGGSDPHAVGVGLGDGCEAAGVA